MTNETNSTPLSKNETDLLAIERIFNLINIGSFPGNMAPIVIEAQQNMKIMYDIVKAQVDAEKPAQTEEVNDAPVTNGE